MAADGWTVVRAAVRARLLGLRLLSIDAEVLVGPAAAPRPATADADGVAPGAVLADAVALLETVPAADGDR